MKAAIVTGASSEIGLETIKKLIKNKYYVYACDLLSRKEKFLDAFSVNQRKSVDFIPFDLTEEKKIKNIADYVNRTNNIDLCINIAGKNLLKPFYEWTYESLKDVFDLNFLYTTLFTKEISLRFIKYNIKGNIIFISSQHGIVANTDRIPYCVSKGMVTQLCKSLALELAPYGIRVNSISPTFVETSDNSAFLNTALMINSARENIPLNRYAKAEEIASAVLFLSTDDSRMITGHDLVIDGGWTIK